MKSISIGSSEEVLRAFTVLIGLCLYFISLTWMPQPLKDFPDLIFVVCCLVSYVTVKKLLQLKNRKTSATFFTPEDRAEWVEKRKKGFLMFLAYQTAKFGIFLTLAFFVVAFLDRYAQGKTITIQSAGELLPLTVLLCSWLGLAISLFEWWDNQDNEKEWQLKHGKSST